MNIVDPPAPVVNTLTVTAAKVDTKAKQLQVTVLNTGAADVFLTGVSLTWPVANGKLMKISLDGDAVYDVPDIVAPSANLTAAQLVADPNKRKIQMGTSDVFEVTFEKTPGTVLNLYPGVLTFSNGATLTIP